MNWHTLLVMETARLLLLAGLLLYLTRQVLAPWLPPDPADRTLASLLALAGALTLLPLWLAQAHLYELISLWFFLTLLALIGLLARPRAGRLTPAYLTARGEAALGWLERRFRREREIEGRSWESIVEPVPLGTQAVGSEAATVSLPEREPPAAAGWRSSGGLVALLAALAVLAAAGYLRILDLWLHPGAPFGDAPVHLKWIQELKLNDLHGGGDGVYTKGMHAIISSLHLLLALDLPTLYRLWGPLSALFGVAVAIWAAMRLSGSRWAGILAGTLVGWVGAGTWWELSRQAGTLPQEAGQVWMLPALWWSYRYLHGGLGRELGLATLAVAVIAAGHWGNLSFLALGLVALGLATLGQVPFHRTLRLAGASLAAALVGEAHVIIGLLAGQPVGGNNPAYLRSAGVAPPVPPFMMAIAAVALGLFLLTLLPRWRPWRGRIRWVLLLFLLWFGAWQIGRVGPSTGTLGIIVGAFTERGLDYLNLAAVLVVALAFGMAEAGLAAAARGRLLAGAAAALLLAGAFAVLPASVQNPGPRLLSDDMVMAMYDLSRVREPGYWAVVGNRNLLPLCLGRCLEQHDYLFVQTFGRLPPGGDRLATAAAQLGSAQLELLAFVPRHPVQPDVPRPPAEVSRFDGALLELQDRWGAWDLAQLVANLQAGDSPPEIVWQGQEFIVYRLWPGQGGGAGG